MLNLLTSVLFVTALAALAWWGRRHEPHWVDRDASRFLCRARILDPKGARPGRWQPVRGGVGRTAIVLQAGFTGNRRINGTYTVTSRMEGAVAGHVLYVLEGPGLAALRIPETSPLVPVLDAMSSHGS